MQKRTNLQRALMLAGCAMLTVVATGCRSMMPKWNPLAWRSTPSAEKLAGNGPTITYPAPPGESAVPEAIASIAGGTSSPDRSFATNTTNQIAEFNSSASNAVSGAVNDAAARANGFNLASTPTQSSIPDYANRFASTPSKNSEIPAIPTGYKFGSRATGPPTGLTAPASKTESTTGRYAMPSSYPAPGPESVVSASNQSTTGRPGMPPTNNPSGGFSLPSMSDASTGPVDLGAPSTPSGFALPQGLNDRAKSPSVATSAQPFTPKTSATASASLAPEMTLPSDGTAGTSATGLSLPGEPAAKTASSSSSPNYRTASAELNPRSTLPSASNSLDNSSGGFAPGSTAGSSEYPATSGYPNTGTEGSFYR